MIRKPSGQHTEGGVGGQEAQGNPGESHILMLCFGQGELISVLEATVSLFGKFKTKSGFLAAQL